VIRSHTPAQEIDNREAKSHQRDVTASVLPIWMEISKITWRFFVSTALVNFNAVVRLK